jgi:hypothetical protein
MLHKTTWLRLLIPHVTVAIMKRITTCPGCGLRAPSEIEQIDERSNASYACQQLYSELTVYTLSLHDHATDFMHQHAVDAYGAQHAGPNSKPMGLTFALAGLYLAYERGYTGRQVQIAHTLLARTPKTWPTFTLPREKASLTVQDVVNAPEDERSAMLLAWAEAVWQIWASEHAKVAELVRERLHI